MGNIGSHVDLTSRWRRYQANGGEPEPDSDELHNKIEVAREMLREHPELLNAKIHAEAEKRVH